MVTEKAARALTDVEFTSCRSSARAQMPGISALIGMPGGGKSTVGRHAGAGDLGLGFSDSDHRDRTAHRLFSIREFFELRG